MPSVSTRVAIAKGIPTTATLMVTPIEIAIVSTQRERDVLKAELRAKMLKTNMMLVRKILIQMLMLKLKLIRRIPSGWRM